MEIVIRKATPDDIPVLVDFQVMLARETENLVLDRAVVETGIKAMFTDHAKGFYQVAVMDNEIAGCHMITYEWSDWRNQWTYWLQSVYIMERYRQHGIFRKMFDNIKSQIENDPGISGVRLYVDKGNEKAQSVYQSIGMNGEHYTVFEWMK